MVDMNKMRGKQDANKKRAKDMLEEIMSDVGSSGGVELNDWEESFLESITDQLDKGYKLSDLQMEKLEEIWEKLF
jgi:hypothetical protein